MLTGRGGCVRVSHTQVHTRCQSMTCETETRHWVQTSPSNQAAGQANTCAIPLQGVLNKRPGLSMCAPAAPSAPNQPWNTDKHCRRPALEEQTAACKTQAHPVRCMPTYAPPQRCVGNSACWCFEVQRCAMDAACTLCCAGGLRAPKDPPACSMRNATCVACCGPCGVARCASAPAAGSNRTAACQYFGTTTARLPGGHQQHRALQGQTTAETAPNQTSLTEPAHGQPSPETCAGEGISPIACNVSSKVHKEPIGSNHKLVGCRLWPGCVGSTPPCDAHALNAM